MGVRYKKVTAMSKELNQGDTAPEFSLKDKDGTVHSLASLDEDFLVIFFYPKDNTPGCTIEARAFTKDLEKFSKVGAKLIGISGGDEKSKAKFCSAHKLKVLLLSDPDFSVSKAYGAFGEKSFMGKRYKGIFRKTFVLGKEGKILHIFDTVKPLGHSKEVFEYIKGLSSAKRASNEG